MDKNELLNSLFKRVEEVVDDLHEQAFGLVDEAFVKADEFLAQVKAEAAARLGGEPRGKGEEVRVKPDVATMREDIKRNRYPGASWQLATRDDTLWDRASEGVIKEYWDALPDGDKSWVKRSDGPL